MLVKSIDLYSEWYVSWNWCLESSVQSVEHCFASPFLNQLNSIVLLIFLSSPFFITQWIFLSNRLKIIVNFLCIFLVWGPLSFLRGISPSLDVVGDFSWGWKWNINIWNQNSPPDLSCSKVVSQVGNFHPRHSLHVFLIACLPTSRKQWNIKQNRSEARPEKNRGLGTKDLKFHPVPPIYELLPYASCPSGKGSRLKKVGKASIFVALPSP